MSICLDLDGFLVAELLGEFEINLFRLVTELSRWGNGLLASMVSIASCIFMMSSA